MSLKSEYQPSPYSKTITEADATALAHLMLSHYPVREDEPLKKQYVVETADNARILIVKSERVPGDQKGRHERVIYRVGERDPADFIARPDGMLMPAEEITHRVETYTDGSPIRVEAEANNEAREMSRAAVAKLYGQLILAHDSTVV